MLELLEGRTPVLFLKGSNQPRDSGDVTIICPWKVARRFRHLHQMRASSTRSMIVTAPPIVPPMIGPRFLSDLSLNVFEGDEEGNELVSVGLRVGGASDVVGLACAGETLNGLEVRLDLEVRLNLIH